MSKIAARKLIRAWSNALAAVGSTTDSKVMEKYMKGIAPFFGVKSVERRKLAEECSSTCIGKKWNWDLLVMIVDHAFEANEREIHYCGVDLAKSKLAKRWIAEMDSSVVALAVNGPLRRWITSKSWWDTVDALASNVAGAFWMHHTEIMRCCMIEWLQHDNIWLRRSAILCQLHCKTLTDEAFLFDSCVSCFGTNEFFINKVSSVQTTLSFELV